MSWKYELDNDYDPPKFGAMDGQMWGLFVTTFLVLAFFGIWIFISWSPDTEGARQRLEEDGYTEIQITGADPLKCGKHDLRGTTFRAKNLAGNTVSGVVCCGVLKGCTIRR